MSHDSAPPASQTPAAGWGAGEGASPPSPTINRSEFHRPEDAAHPAAEGAVPAPVAQPAAWPSHPTAPAFQPLPVGGQGWGSSPAAPSTPSPEPVPAWSASHHPAETDGGGAFGGAGNWNQSDVAARAHPVQSSGEDGEDGEGGYGVGHDSLHEMAGQGFDPVTGEVYGSHPVDQAHPVAGASYGGSADGGADDPFSYGEEGHEGHEGYEDGFDHHDGRHAALYGSGDETERAAKDEFIHEAFDDEPPLEAMTPHPQVRRKGRRSPVVMGILGLCAAAVVVVLGWSVYKEMFYEAAKPDVISTYGLRSSGDDPEAAAARARFLAARNGGGGSNPMADAARQAARANQPPDAGRGATDAAPISPPSPPPAPPSAGGDTSTGGVPMPPPAVVAAINSGQTGLPQTMPPGPPPAAADAELVAARAAAVSLAASCRECDTLVAARAAAVSANGAVDALKKQAGELERKVSGLAAELGASTRAVAAMQAERDDAMNAKTSLTEQVASLTAQVGALNAQLTVAKQQADSARIEADRRGAGATSAVSRERNSDLRDRRHTQTQRDAGTVGQASPRCRLVGADTGVDNDGPVAWISLDGGEAQEVSVGDHNACVGTVRHISRGNGGWVVKGSQHNLTLE